MRVVNPHHARMADSAMAGSAMKIPMPDSAKKIPMPEAKDHMPMPMPPYSMHGKQNWSMVLLRLHVSAALRARSVYSALRAAV